MEPPKGTTCPAGPPGIPWDYPNMNAAQITRWLMDTIKYDREHGTRLLYSYVEDVAACMERDSEAD